MRFMMIYRNLRSVPCDRSRMDGIEELKAGPTIPVSPEAVSAMNGPPS